MDLSMWWKLNRETDFPKVYAQKLEAVCVDNDDLGSLIGYSFPNETAVNLIFQHGIVQYDYKWQPSQVQRFHRLDDRE